MIDLLFLLLFVLFLSFLLYRKRRNLKVEKLLFHLVYVVMYSSSFGLRFMGRVAHKHRRLVRVLGFLGVAAGFAGMIYISFTLVNGFFNTLFAHAAPNVAPVLPLPIKGVVYVPFLQWIICIFVLALVHEFAHGIVAGAYNIRVKRSGFALLCIIFPVIPLAFVEPDEDDLQRRPLRQQLSVFAAGSFANLVLGVIIMLSFALVVPLVSTALFEEKGVLVVGFTNDSAAQLSGMNANEIITFVDDAAISTVNDLSGYLGNKSVGSTAVVRTNVSSYAVKLSADSKGKSQLGVLVTPFSELKQGIGKPFSSLVLWLVGLFYWLFVLNIGIGMFNLVPLGPIDGGRMLHSALQKFLSRKRAFLVWQSVSVLFFAVVFLSIALSFFK